MDIKQAAFDILILRAAEHRFSQNKRCQLDGVGSRGDGERAGWVCEVERGVV